MSRTLPVSRPLRVLTVIDGFRLGGAETLLAPLAGACADAEIEMSFVSISPPSVNAEKTVSILAEAGVAPHSLHIRRLLDPVAIPRLAREIRTSRCDIVHSHLEMATTLSSAAARLANRPVVGSFHHVARGLSGRAAMRERLAVTAATKASYAVFVSEASRSSFQKMYRPKKMPANWRVVHNGIDLARFDAGPADPNVRAALAAGGKKLVVLPAALRDLKGIPVAIEAWLCVVERFPDAVLALVGAGTLESELRQQVAALGLERSVIFAGARTDMPSVYRAADVVLLPSVHENFPTVLIEASAARRPIAASAVGGIPEIVRDRENGLLFKPGDPAALAAAVVELLGNPALADQLGASAKVRAQEFSATAWVHRLRQLYEEAIGFAGQE